MMGPSILALGRRPVTKRLQYSGLGLGFSFINSAASVRKKPVLRRSCRFQRISALAAAAGTLAGRRRRRLLMLILRSVGVLSAGRVLGCLYALLGLIVGAFVSLFAIAGAAVGPNQGPGAGVMFFGFG